MKKLIIILVIFLMSSSICYADDSDKNFLNIKGEKWSLSIDKDSMTGIWAFFAILALTVIVPIGMYLDSKNKPIDRKHIMIILEKRYAQGELTREEYEVLKNEFNKSDLNFIKNNSLSPGKNASAIPEKRSNNL